MATQLADEATSNVDRNALQGENNGSIPFVSKRRIQPEAIWSLNTPVDQAGPVRFATSLNSINGGLFMQRDLERCEGDQKSLSQPSNGLVDDKYIKLLQTADALSRELSTRSKVPSSADRESRSINACQVTSRVSQRDFTANYSKEVNRSAVAARASSNEAQSVGSDATETKKLSVGSETNNFGRRKYHPRKSHYSSLVDVSRSLGSYRTEAVKYGRREKREKTDRSSNSDGVLLTSTKYIDDSINSTDDRQSLKFLKKNVVSTMNVIKPDAPMSSAAVTTFEHISPTRHYAMPSSRQLLRAWEAATCAETLPENNTRSGVDESFSQPLVASSHRSGSVLDLLANEEPRFESLRYSPVLQHKVEQDHKPSRNIDDITDHYLRLVSPVDSLSLSGMEPKLPTSDRPKSPSHSQCVEDSLPSYKYEDHMRAVEAIADKFEYIPEAYRYIMKKDAMTGNLEKTSNSMRASAKVLNGAVDLHQMSEGYFRDTAAFTAQSSSGRKSTDGATELQSQCQPASRVGTPSEKQKRVNWRDLSDCEKEVPTEWVSSRQRSVEKLPSNNANGILDDLLANKSFRSNGYVSATRSKLNSSLAVDRSDLRSEFVNSPNKIYTSNTVRSNEIPQRTTKDRSESYSAQNNLTSIRTPKFSHHHYENPGISTRDSKYIGHAQSYAKPPSFKEEDLYRRKSSVAERNPLQLDAEYRRISRQDTVGLFDTGTTTRSQSVPPSPISSKSPLMHSGELLQISTDLLQAFESTDRNPSPQNSDWYSSKPRSKSPVPSARTRDNSDTSFKYQRSLSPQSVTSSNYALKASSAVFSVTEPTRSVFYESARQPNDLNPAPRFNATTESHDTMRSRTEQKMPSKSIDSYTYKPRIDKLTQVRTTNRVHRVHEQYASETRLHASSPVPQGSHGSHPPTATVATNTVTPSYDRLSTKEACVSYAYASLFNSSIIATADNLRRTEMSETRRTNLSSTSVDSSQITPSKTSMPFENSFSQSTLLSTTLSSLNTSQSYVTPFVSKYFYRPTGATTDYTPNSPSASHSATYVSPISTQSKPSSDSASVHYTDSFKTTTSHASSTVTSHVTPYSASISSRSQLAQSTSYEASAIYSSPMSNCFHATPTTRSVSVLSTVSHDSPVLTRKSYDATFVGSSIGFTSSLCNMPTTTCVATPFASSKSYDTPAWSTAPPANSYIQSATKHTTVSAKDKPTGQTNHRLDATIKLHVNHMPFVAKDITYSTLGSYRNEEVRHPRYHFTLHDDAYRSIGLAPHSSNISRPAQYPTFDAGSKSISLSTPDLSFQHLSEAVTYNENVDTNHTTSKYAYKPFDDAPLMKGNINKRDARPDLLVTDTASKVIASSKDDRATYLSLSSKNTGAHIASSSVAKPIARSLAESFTTSTAEGYNLPPDTLRSSRYDSPFIFDSRTHDSLTFDSGAYDSRMRYTPSPDYRKQDYKSHDAARDSPVYESSTDSIRTLPAVVYSSRAPSSCSMDSDEHNSSDPLPSTCQRLHITTYSTGSAGLGSTPPPPEGNEWVDKETEMTEMEWVVMRSGEIISRPFSKGAKLFDDGLSTSHTLFGLS